MKRNNLFTAFFVLLTMALLSSCANKVDINADYKDISIAYGLLDASQTRHYVKFTKAFQTNNNVVVAAKDPSKSQYNPDNIEMWLEEYRNGSAIRRINMDTLLITDKDSGIFYYPNQIVYATPEGTVLNQNSEYRFKAKIKSTGKIVEASTNMVHDFSIVRPISLAKYLDFSGNYMHTVEWRSAKNGKLYQLVIRFYYTDISAYGIKTSHYVDWVFPQIKSQRTDGGEKMKYDFMGSSFYSILKEKIPAALSGQKRWADSLYYIFEVADENFSVYMDVSAPASSIVQERPSYSNISNGIGLFASRYQKKRFFEGLMPQSLDTLYHGSKTYSLGFEKRP